MSRSTCRLLAGILLVLLSDSVSRLAQQGEQVWYLPGAAETAGKNGAVYSSTLTITNPGSELAQLQINFIPYAGILAPAAVDQVISAGETLRVERVLSTLFSLNSSAGTLVLNSNRDIYCLLTTSNIANPVGTYGLAVKPVLSQDKLHAGQTGQSIWVSEGVDFRTNVAVALLEANSTVGVSVYDNAGFLRGKTTVSSAVPVSWQSPIPDLVGPLPLPLGRVQFEVVKGSAIGYTAVVDNVTGDGIAVVAQELSAGVSDWILNGVAHSPGVGGTYWSTDIRIFNPNPEAVDLSIKSLGISGESRSILRTVSGDGLLELTDVLGPNGLQVSQASAGAVRFQASKPFLVVGRTSNSDPTGNRRGSYSADIRAIPLSDGMISTSGEAMIGGLDQGGQFRTNLAFLAGPDGAQGDLSLHDGQGLPLATVALSLGPWQWQQKNLAAWFALSSNLQRVRVGLQLTAGTLDGYASRIDNGTGDAVVLPLTRVSTAPQLPGGSPTISGCRIFPPDNPWNRDISADPVDPNSANYLASMNASFRYLHPDFGSNPTYGIPYVVVAGTQAKVPMSFDYSDESDPGPYPIPPDAPIEGGVNSSGDRHVLVLDKDNGLLYETWDSHYLSPGWRCGSGAIFDLKSNQLRPDGWTSADAAGLPILPGLVRYEESAIQGEIRHAVRFTVQRTQRAYVHPATHFASQESNSNLPPMGLRVRLKANYDLSRFTGASKVILTALKRYGMFVADNGSDWFITGATDTRWNDEDLEQIKTVPASAFEVVKLGTIFH